MILQKNDIKEVSPNSWEKGADLTLKPGFNVRSAPFSARFPARFDPPIVPIDP